MVAGLRRLGFDKVFDTDFTADLTIMEEGNELIQRLQNGGALPLITSCCPGWIKFIEHFYPELLPHLSTCKSPQQMFGALAKTYYAEKAGIDPEDIVVGLDHALHGQEVRVRAAGDEGQRLPGRGRAS